MRLTRPLEEHAFTRTYIKATADKPAAGAPLTGSWRNAEFTRNHPAWRHREIETTHMVPNNRPNDLVQLLLEVIA